MTHDKLPMFFLYFEQMKFTIRQLFTTMRHLNDDLDEKSVDRDPIKQFQLWFAEARSAKIMLPEAMTLSTVTSLGTPSGRMVLLKSVDERGFVFYTNYQSAKARELDIHHNASLVFHWDSLQRQVRISGTVSKISAQESDAYFKTRARESQISAHASPQSDVVTSREALDAHYARVEEMYSGKPVPRPEDWGGFCVKPFSIEFWKGRVGRLHDRILYERGADGIWSIKRLAP